MIYPVLTISHRWQCCSFTRQYSLSWDHFLALPWLQPWYNPPSPMATDFVLHPPHCLFSTYQSERSGSINQMCVTLLHKAVASVLPAASRPHATWFWLVHCLIPSQSTSPSVFSTTLAVTLSCLEHTALVTCCSFPQASTWLLRPFPQGSPRKAFPHT